MQKDNITSAGDIEKVVFDILKTSKSLGVFPTPVDRIIRFTDLSVDYSVDLSTISYTGFWKKSGALKRASNKIRGALDRKKRSIYLDLSQRDSRKRFVKLHEVGHDALPWQRELYRYFEDDDVTIDPDTDDFIELEANYFASATLFQLDRFQQEAKYLPLEIDSAMKLAKKFGSSNHAAIRRFVEYSPYRCALLVLNNPTSEHSYMISKKNYFQSPGFTSEFGRLVWPEIMNMDLPFVGDVYFGKRWLKNGVLDFSCKHNGPIEFQYHYFNNTYNSFILIMPVGEKKIS